VELCGGESVSQSINIFINHKEEQMLLFTLHPQKYPAIPGFPPTAFSLSSFPSFLLHLISSFRSILSFFHQSYLSGDQTDNLLFTSLHLLCCVTPIAKQIFSASRLHTESMRKHFFLPCGANGRTQKNHLKSVHDAVSLSALRYSSHRFGHLELYDTSCVRLRIIL